jgi:hypothetical protein
MLFEILIGGNTLIGQVASFMETLGMSYNEILHTPYGSLLMMQNDKIRVDYSSGEKTDKVRNMTGKEMLKKKRE